MKAESVTVLSLSLFSMISKWPKHPPSLLDIQVYISLFLMSNRKFVISSGVVGAFLFNVVPSPCPCPGSHQLSLDAYNSLLDISVFPHMAISLLF